MHLMHSPTCSIPLYESKGVATVICSDISLSGKATQNMQNMDVSVEDNHYLDMSYSDASSSSNMILLENEEENTVNECKVSFEDSNPHQLVGGGVISPSNTTYSFSTMPDTSLQTQYDKFVLDGYYQMNHKTKVELLKILKDAKGPTVCVQSNHGLGL
jgi:hypothetical protein